MVKLYRVFRLFSVRAVNVRVDKIVRHTVTPEIECVRYTPFNTCAFREACENEMVMLKVLNRKA